MKNRLKFISGVVFALLLLSSCGDKKYGFISMDENAGYTVDTLLVYVTPPTSSNQYKYGSPYYTTALEGVQGTQPLTYKLANITGDNPQGVKRLLEIVEVKFGLGSIVIPSKEHRIPEGTYWISVAVNNCYGQFEIPNVLKVVVK